MKGNCGGWLEKFVREVLEKFAHLLQKEGDGFENLSPLGKKIPGIAAYFFYSSRRNTTVDRDFPLLPKFSKDIIVTKISILVTNTYSYLRQTISLDFLRYSN